MNSVNLVGRMTMDPDLRFIPGSGQAVCKFSIAINKNLSKEKKAGFENKNKPTADFPRVIVFGKAAENVAQYTAKGLMVSVTGSIQTGSYKKENGDTVYTTEILAHRVEFLEWGDKQQDKESSQQDFQEVDPFDPNSEEIPF